MYLTDYYEYFAVRCVLHYYPFVENCQIVSIWRIRHQIFYEEILNKNFTFV